MPSSRSLRLPTNPRMRALVLTLAAVAAVVVVNQLLETSSSGRGTPIALDFQGILFGLGDALIAAGLIVVYRINRIINFSAFALGVPAALLTFDTIYYTHFPLAVTLLVGVCFGAVIGAVVELAVGRRFSRRSRLQFTIITIAFASVVTQTLTPLVDKAPWLPPQSVRNKTAIEVFGALDDKLPLRGFHFTIGGIVGLPFRFGSVLALELAAAALVALALFLRFSRLGVAMRSVAQNTERAGLLGIDTGAIATIAWAVAGALAALGVIIQGLIGDTGVVFGAKGPSGASLLLPLTAATLARFRSVPAAVGWVLGLQVLQSGVIYNHPNSAPLVNGGQLVLIVVALLAQNRGQVRLAVGEEGSWRLAAEQRPVPRVLAQMAGIRATKAIAALVLLAVAIMLPFVLSAGTTSTIAQAFLLGIVGLSLVVLTGWNGQVSLGQYAFIVAGAVVAGGAVERGHVPFLIAVPLGALVSSAIAVGVGLPALRVRGLFLGVVTFALVPATTAILFDPGLFGWLVPKDVARPHLLGLSLDSEMSYYFVALVVLLLCVLLVANIRRTSIGRTLIAARDNEAALQAAGVPIVRTKLVGFAISGGLAGLAGALFVFELRGVSATSFASGASLDLFYFTVLGGISSITGALMGVAALTVYTSVHNSVFQQVAPAVSIAIIYTYPGGLMELFTMARDSVLRIVAQRRQLLLPSLFDDVDLSPDQQRLIPLGLPITGAGLSALPRATRYRSRSRFHGRDGAVDEALAFRDESALVAAATALAEPAASATGGTAR